MNTVGIVGLGRMGFGIVARLRERGLSVMAHDRDPTVSDVPSLEALVEQLPQPRIVWLMVPAGGATAGLLQELEHLLDEGDIVVDGSNSNWRETVQRAASLGAAGIHLIDVGVSGGVWGAENGYALMAGGPRPIIDQLRPLFDRLTPDHGGFSHAGPSGAGHYAKMVHNAIEYGMMQALGEGYELLESGGPDGLDPAAILHGWQDGTVIRSWLLDLLNQALDEDPELQSIRGFAEDSGEGRWAVEEAVNAAVAIPAIAAALFARFSSRKPDATAMKVVAALRKQFGGHAIRHT